MQFSFDAYVTDVRFERSGRAAFLLGDGTVRWNDGGSISAHDGAILCGAVHPSGEGVVSGGDDGRLVWSRPQGAEQLAEAPGRWIDALAVSPASGLIAFAAGREVHLRDVADPRFANLLRHERAAAALAFEPKGRRLAVASYGGAALWYARVAQQKPQWLKWAGSHIGAAFSPDGRFLVSSMQEGVLHGWRLSDAADMRMEGYPSKVRSLAFLDKGRFLATSGASGVVLWPFSGAGGPMGQPATEIGFQDGAVVSRVAAAPALARVAAGLEDGRVWQAGLSGAMHMVKAEKGAPITALAMSDDGARLAWGDEEGGAGLVELPA